LHANTFANDGYAHHYWVDGSPFAGDVQIDSSHWATVLVGTLGAGGPGYFVLNVSSPSAFSASNVMLDATDTSATSALTGQTITNGPKAGQPVLNYIGNQFNQPVMALFSSNQSAQIMRINTSSANPDWAVIMGNGYNSVSGVPVLLIQSLTEPGMPLYTVSATCTGTADCVAAGNGLGAPRAVDVDGNGTADIVYAGDLMGNLWKFDISDLNPANWKVAYGGKPMFTAVGPTGAPQPITSAPVAVPNPYGHGGFLVAFGTGKNLTDADTADQNLNSVYGLYDAQVIGVQAVAPADSGSQSSRIRLTEPPPNTFCNGSSGAAARYGCLYQQSGGAISEGTSQTATDANGNSVTVTSNISSKNVTDDGIAAMGQPPAGGSGATMLGWYYDIPEVANGNAAKVLANPSMMDGNTLVFYSQNVASSSGTGVSSGGATSAPDSTSESGSSTESCDPTTASGPITTVNFFNILTGNYPDNTITIGNQTYNAGHGNRFQMGGTTYLQNGANSLSQAGKGGIGLTSKTNVTEPGKVIGWRILR
jgi:type IV pilus assembly protein PilY1